MKSKYKYKKTNNSNFKTNSRGYTYEHMIVAEKILGRPLLRGETIHHKDENKSNNKVSNLMVFSTNADHSRFHSGTYDRLEVNSNVWKCLKLDRICKQCGAVFTGNPKQTFCSVNCSRIFSRRSTRPSKEELFTLLKLNSFVALGEKYNVSDNAIRKWCISYDIPSKAKYYRTLIG